MKKVLLGASALAMMTGAALASEPIQPIRLGVSGYYNIYAVAVSQEDGAGMPGAGTRNSDIKRDGQINLIGETRLDSGIFVGAQVDLASFNAIESFTTENSLLYASGGFGKFIVGEDYAASYLLQVAAPAVDESFDGMDPTYELFNRNGNIAPASYAQSAGILVGGFDHSAKVTYLTPVMGGFQAGASYVPDHATTPTFAGMRTDTSVSSIDVAMKYAGSADTTTYDLGFGYTAVDNELTGREPSGFNLGANVGFGAFTIGAAYDKLDMDLANSDSEAYALGVNYQMNEATTLGASYFHGAREMGAGVADDKLTRILVGGAYSYGPGMTFNGSVQHFELESATATDENDGWALVLGTCVSF